MKQNLITKSLLVVAALGLTAAARADATAAAGSMPASGSMGLLGQTYAGVAYSYTDIDDSTIDADNYIFEYNQPLSAGFDAVFAYDYGQSEVILGSRFKTQSATAGLRAYSINTGWAKPYIEAGLGYAWTKFAGNDDNSYLWQAAIGAEFQVAPAFTVTPFVQYSDAPDLVGSDGAWDYGVKANYWLNNRWSLAAAISRDDDQNMGYQIGVNCRF